MYVKVSHFRLVSNKQAARAIGGITMDPMIMHKNATVAIVSKNMENVVAKIFTARSTARFACMLWNTRAYLIKEELRMIN